MINGEGTRGTSSAVATHDLLDELLPWQGQKSDDSGDADAASVLSQYSSCGESDFERYFSANSVMGTPSLCGSVGTFHECPDSEFGSVRSFTLGDDSGLENFSLGGTSDRKVEDKKLSSFGDAGFCQKIETYDGKNEAELRDAELGQGSVGMKNGLNLRDNMERTSSHELNDMDNGNMMSSKVGGALQLPTVADLSTALDEGLYGDDDLGGVLPWRDNNETSVVQNSSKNRHTKDKANAEDIKEEMSNLGAGDGLHFSAGAEEGSQSHMGTEWVESCLDGLNSECGLEFDRREDGRCSDDGEASSRYEHSEGEDSMFECGTDDENKMVLYSRSNAQYLGEGHRKNQNSLVMTSSIAFGSEDWDDFVQERGEEALTSMIPDELLGQDQQSIENERDHLNSISATATEFPSIGTSEQKDARDILVYRNQLHGAGELMERIRTCSKKPTDPLKFGEAEQIEDAKGMFVPINHVRDDNKFAEYPETASVSDLFGTEQHPLTQGAPLKERFNINDGGLEKGRQCISIKEIPGIDDSQVSTSIELERTELQLNPLSEVTFSQLYPSSRETNVDRMVEVSKDHHNSYSLPSLPENNIKESPVSVKLFEDQPRTIKVENPELNEFYNEVVHEMEEILLDSGESSGCWFTQGNRIYQSQIPLPSRDGGSTASTSGMDDTDSLIRRPPRIDGIEVVGARQKNGDVSFAERLVGVKEYTVYKIKVWSGEDHWEVERRYRDFCTLYRRLKTLFAEQGWILPSTWSSIERESRKIFGNASPDVIVERSVLIQECLQSIIHSSLSTSPPSALIWFLSLPESVFSSLASNTYMPRSPFSARSMDPENNATLGKTISLVVEIQPCKSMKEMLEAQHYTCAGCHRHFDDGKTRMLEFVQTLGWGKPRRCEYSGQLFCSSCHTNETAVLPARVLHHWDFTEYPVSQLAKSYLDSIHDQPMLCVSAVNPFLFSKVPALQHVTNVRKKIGAMLPYVHCPFRRSIYKGLGSRRYLLESNDFFALRDLIDLSKGVFAALPVIVETVSKKILDHISEHCLICCDVGVPCNARQACDNPCSLIFPFQEGEVERCRSCESVFHKPCFKKIERCPCGEHLNVKGAKGGTTKAHPGSGRVVDGTLDLLGREADSRSSVGFLSGLLSKVRPEKLWGPRDSDTVMLMGSLPSTSL